MSDMKVSGDWPTSQVRQNAFPSQVRHGGGSWPIARAPGEVVPVALIASATFPCVSPNPVLTAPRLP